MHKIAVSDIFGVTPAFNELCNQLKGETVIVDPYCGEQLEFTSENAAYSFFMENVGLEKYVNILETKIALIPAPFTIIGFSVGGSAIWKLAANPPDTKIVIPSFRRQRILFQ